MANVGLLFGHASGMCALNVFEVLQIYFLGICAAIQPVGHLNMKMLSYQYRDPHVKYKTVLRPSLFLTCESPYLERQSLYRDWAQMYVCSLSMMWFVACGINFQYFNHCEYNKNYIMEFSGNMPFPLHGTVSMNQIINIFTSYFTKICHVFICDCFSKLNSYCGQKFA